MFVLSVCVCVFVGEFIKVNVTCFITLCMFHCIKTLRILGCIFICINLLARNKIFIKCSFSKVEFSCLTWFTREYDLSVGVYLFEDVVEWMFVHICLSMFVCPCLLVLQLSLKHVDCVAYLGTGMFQTCHVKSSRFMFLIYVTPCLTSEDYVLSCIIHSRGMSNMFLI